jgi:hypothetical protein
MKQDNRRMQPLFFLGIGRHKYMRFELGRSDCFISTNAGLKIKLLSMRDCRKEENECEERDCRSWMNEV